MKSFVATLVLVLALLTNGCEFHGSYTINGKTKYWSSNKPKPQPVSNRRTSVANAAEQRSLAYRLAANGNVKAAEAAAARGEGTEADVESGYSYFKTQMQILALVGAAMFSGSGSGSGEKCNSCANGLVRASNQWVPCSACGGTGKRR